MSIEFINLSDHYELEDAILSCDNSFPVIVVTNSGLTTYCHFCMDYEPVDKLMRKRKDKLVSVCDCGARQRRVLSSESYTPVYQWYRKIIGQNVAVMKNADFKDKYESEEVERPGGVSNYTVVVTNDELTWVCPYCLRYGCSYDILKKRKDQIVAYCKCGGKEERFFPHHSDLPMYRWYRKLVGQTVEIAKGDI